MRFVRRWLRLLKLWLVVQALPVIDPKLCRAMRFSERQIRDANQLMRRRRGQAE